MFSCLSHLNGVHKLKLFINHVLTTLCSYVTREARTTFSKHVWHETSHENYHSWCNNISYSFDSTRVKSWLKSLLGHVKETLACSCEHEFIVELYFPFMIFLYVPSEDIEHDVKLVLRRTYLWGKVCLQISEEIVVVGVSKKEPKVGISKWKGKLNYDLIKENFQHSALLFFLFFIYRVHFSFRKMSHICLRKH